MVAISAGNHAEHPWAMDDITVHDGNEDVLLTDLQANELFDLDGDDLVSYAEFNSKKNEYSEQGINPLDLLTNKVNVSSVATFSVADIRNPASSNSANFINAFSAFPPEAQYHVENGAGTVSHSGITFAHDPNEGWIPEDSCTIQDIKNDNINNSAEFISAFDSFSSNAFFIPSRSQVVDMSQGSLQLYNHNGQDWIPMLGSSSTPESTTVDSSYSTKGERGGVDSYSDSTTANRSVYGWGRPDDDGGDYPIFRGVPVYGSYTAERPAPAEDVKEPEFNWEYNSDLETQENWVNYNLAVIQTFESVEYGMDMGKINSLFTYFIPPYDGTDNSYEIDSGKIHTDDRDESIHIATAFQNAMGHAKMRAIHEDYIWGSGITFTDITNLGQGASWEPYIS
ncbi:hypothetical protein ACFL4D_00085 [Candidatus Margulisiibacteriota bacterium]